jgi:integrase
MASVYRTYQTRRNDPQDPKSKSVPFLDAKGRPVPHPRWRFEYTDYQGKRRSATGSEDKRETEKLAARVQAREDEIRRGFRPPPKSADKAATRPFREVAAEYCENGELHGGRGGRPWGPEHARKRRDHLEWWAQELSLDSLADLAGVLPRAEAALRELSEAGRSGKTLANRAESLKGFCHWARNRGYIDGNPLEHLGRFDITPRSRRRAMTPEEVQALFDAAPPDRRLVYATAAASGLRAGELIGLQVRDLDPNRPAIHVRAELSKSRKPATLPIPGELWGKLIAEAADRPPDAPVFQTIRDLSEWINRDLTRAGVRKWTPEGKLDFHALRVFDITAILESGAELKTAQTLARHATPDLTMNTYGRSRHDRLTAAAEAVGKVVFSGPDYISEPKRKVVGWESETITEVFMVRGGGLEPPQDCSHKALNLARLPIPPSSQ